MIWEDPIVKEVREVRDKIASQHDYDVKEIGRYYQKKQAKNADKLVTLKPKRPETRKSA